VQQNQNEEVITGSKVCEFKGENGPQSPAFLFSVGSDDPLALERFKLIEGTPPSFNNWCDIERLLQTMTHLATGWLKNYGIVQCIAVGDKHGNPCGATIKSNEIDAVRDMVRGNDKSIFGGFVLVNFRVTREIAEAMAQAMPGGRAMFDGVIAPYFDEDAIEVLARKKGKCRLMTNPALDVANTVAENLCLDMTPRFRYVRGGFLLEPNYTFVLDFKHPEMKVYGQRNERAENNLLLAWAVGCTSNSNTITIAANSALIGNGVGQQDRVGAAKLAIERAVDAGHKALLEGAVAYSDSFFPFEDGVRVLIDAGITAVFSTSGSIRDKFVQDLCVEKGVTLYQLPDALARGFFAHG